MRCSIFHGAASPKRQGPPQNVPIGRHTWLCSVPQIWGFRLFTHHLPLTPYSKGRIANVSFSQEDKVLQMTTLVIKANASNVCINDNRSAQFHGHRKITKGNLSERNRLSRTDTAFKSSPRFVYFVPNSIKPKRRWAPFLYHRPSLWPVVTQQEASVSSPKVKSSHHH